MTSYERILNQLLTVKYATINNFFSRTATSLKGSRLQSYKTFRKLEEKGLIRPIPYNEFTRNPQQEQFYYLTPKGAREIGRLSEYSYKEPKAITNAKHESAKIDIAMSFLLGYPDYLIDFDYYASLDGYKPDILIRMQTPDLKKKYSFIVELERKKHPARTYQEKIRRIEKIFARLDYRKYGLSEHTKVLIVWNNLSFNPYFRPQEYGQKEVSERIEILKKQFEHFLKLCKDLPTYRYRFIPFYEFTILHKSLWHTPDKKRRLLIHSS